MKIHFKTVGSQFEKFSLGNIPDIDTAANLEARRNEMIAFEKKIKKLNLALGNLPIADNQLQKRLIDQAEAYVAKLAKDTPLGLRKSLKITANEISSIKDGLNSGLATPNDLFFNSGKEILSLIAKVKNKIKAADTDFAEVERIIKKNKELETKIPTIGVGEVGAARVPVAFSLSRNPKQSSVGYLDREGLARAGFKADFIDGYAIIHNQLAIGISKDTLAEYPAIKETKLVYKADKPVKVIKRRPATTLDVAHEVKKQLESRTKTKWVFVMEKGYPYKGATWFWVMNRQDAASLAKLFPGGRLKLQSWGIAL